MEAATPKPAEVLTIQLTAEEAMTLVLSYGIFTAFISGARGRAALADNVVSFVAFTDDISPARMVAVTNDLIRKIESAEHWAHPFFCISPTCKHKEENDKNGK